MSKAPAFQFYAADFMMSTAAMSAEEVGAYVRLLCYQWINGGIPDDQDVAARIAGCNSDVITSIWSKFDLYGDGKRKNARLEDVRTKQQSFREKQSKNSAEAWKKRKDERLATPKPYGLDMASHSQAICQNDALQSSSSSSYTSSNEEVIICAAEASPASDLFPEDAKVKREKPKKPTGRDLTDEQFIASLRSNPAYAHFNVDSELGRIDAWLLANPGRQKTRKFVVRWLNRIQPPLEHKKVTTGNPAAIPAARVNESGVKIGGW